MRVTDMIMNWNSNGNGNGNGQQPPQQQGYGQPTGAGFAPGGGGQVRTYGSLEDLNGLNEAIPDSRFPELPGGVKALFKVESFALKPTAYGLKQFCEGTVMQCSNAQLVNTIATTKISGFSNVQRQKMALQDLKGLLLAIYVPKGMPKDYAGDFIAIARDLNNNPAPVIGTLIEVQSEVRLPSKPGHSPFTKYVYLPVDQQTGSPLGR